MITNPFFLSANIPPEYFCDREKETEKLTNYLLNGNNVTLISPRRMGKSGLINHCFRQKKIKDNFSTLYIDILQTTSLREFVFLFGKAVYEKIVPKTKKWISSFFQTLKSLHGKITFDPFSGLPSFNMFIGEITNPEFTLDEIFDFLNRYDKKCIIAIDEFQQISHYTEKNVEAILRSHIQQQNNAYFIFSGSERHIMNEMFLTANRPFYHSSSIMILEAIPKDIYTDFASHLFKRFGKKIESDAIDFLYNLFNGYTYYLQKTLNEVFSRIDKMAVCDVEKIKESIYEILEDNSTKYREILSNIPDRQKELLYAIAIEREVEKITSGEFIKKYNLFSTSSVQSAMRVLLEKDYITHLDSKYFLTDKFLSLWIKQIYGSGDI